MRIFGLKNDAQLMLIQKYYNSKSMGTEGFRHLPLHKVSLIKTASPFEEQCPVVHQLNEVIVQKSKNKALTTLMANRELRILGRHFVLNVYYS